MTESQWLSSTQPMEMLGFLVDSRLANPPTDRAYRAFACACVRRVESLLTDRRSRAALVTAERRARGEATARELEWQHRDAHAAAQQAHQRFLGGEGDEGERAAALLAAECARDLARSAAWQVCSILCRSFTGGRTAGLADLLRDILGNPFHAPTLPAHWREWNEGTIPRLALAIRKHNSRDEYLILADALEEAGCSDERLIAHCRSDAGHASSCWVLELLCEE